MSSVGYGPAQAPADLIAAPALARAVSAGVYANRSFPACFIRTNVPLSWYSSQPWPIACCSPAQYFGRRRLVLVDHRTVDLLDVDPPILDGLECPRVFHDPAGGFLGIGVRTLCGEFHRWGITTSIPH